MQNELEIAWRYYDEGNISDAQNILENLASNNPHNFKYIFNCGTFFQKINDHERSIIYFEKALQLKECDVVYFNLGFSYAAMDHHQKAVIYYDKAILLGENFDYPYNKAVSLNILNDKFGAIACFDESLRLFPNNYESIRGKGYIYQDIGKNEEATKIFKNALEAQPENIDVLYDLGYSLGLEEKYKEAEKYYKLHLEKETNPINMCSTLNNLGLTYEKLGKLKLALENYNKACNADPTNRVCKENLNRLSQRLEKKNEKMKFLEKKTNRPKKIISDEDEEIEKEKKVGLDENKVLKSPNNERVKPSQRKNKIIDEPFKNITEKINAFKREKTDSGISPVKESETKDKDKDKAKETDKLKPKEKLKEADKEKEKPREIPKAKPIEKPKEQLKEKALKVIPKEKEKSKESSEIPKEKSGRPVIEIIDDELEESFNIIKINKVIDKNKFITPNKEESEFHATNPIVSAKHSTKNTKLKSSLSKSELSDKSEKINASKDTPVENKKSVSTKNTNLTKKLSEENSCDKLSEENPVESESTDYTPKMDLDEQSQQTPQSLKYEHVVEFKKIIQHSDGTLYYMKDRLNEYLVKQLPPMDHAENTRILKKIKTFSEIYCTNFLYYLGYKLEKGQISINLEAGKGGILREILNANTKMSTKHKLKIIHDIASGMEVMHLNNVYNIELNSSKVIIVNIFNDFIEPIAKIIDNGLSDEFKEKKLVDNIMVEWMSPEQLLGDPNITKANSYSLGVIMWEIFTGGKMPYEELKHKKFSPIQFSTNIIFNKLRPDLSLLERNTPKVVKALISECFETPEKRPSVGTILQTIYEVYDAIKSK